MTARSLFRGVVAAIAIVGVAGPAITQTASAVCAACVKTHMEALAGDALRGRDCATEDEHKASLYVEGELKSLGLQPAFAGGMRQAAPLATPRLAAPATLDAGGRHFAFENDFLMFGDFASAKGRLVHVSDADRASNVSGAVVFYDKPGRDRAAIRKLTSAGAAAVLFPADKTATARWSAYASALKPRSRVVGAENEPAQGATVMLSEAAADAVRALADGTPMTLDREARRARAQHDL